MGCTDGISVANSGQILIFRETRWSQGGLLSCGCKNPPSEVFFLKIYLFIFGCTGSMLLCMCFLQLQRAGAALCCGAQALDVQTSVAAASGLSGCGTWAQPLCGMWDLLGPGIAPVSLALQGGFLTTGPSGKPLVKF